MLGPRERSSVLWSLTSRFQALLALVKEGKVHEGDRAQEVVETLLPAEPEGECAGLPTLPASNPSEEACTEAFKGWYEEQGMLHQDPRPGSLLGRGTEEKLQPQRDSGVGDSPDVAYSRYSEDGALKSRWEAVVLVGEDRAGGLPHDPLASSETNRSRWNVVGQVGAYLERVLVTQPMRDFAVGYALSLAREGENRCPECIVLVAERGVDGSVGRLYATPVCDANRIMPRLLKSSAEQLGFAGLDPALSAALGEDTSISVRMRGSAREEARFHPLAVLKAPAKPFKRGKPATVAGLLGGDGPCQGKARWAVAKLALGQGIGGRKRERALELVGREADSLLEMEGAGMDSPLEERGPVLCGERGGCVPRVVARAEGCVVTEPVGRKLQKELEKLAKTIGWTKAGGQESGDAFSTREAALKGLLESGGGELNVKGEEWEQEERVRLVEGVYDVLRRAHERGIEHRDVHPLNVVAAAGGQGGEGKATLYQVIDFELSRYLPPRGGQYDGFHCSQGTGTFSCTRASAIMGGEKPFVTWRRMARDDLESLFFCAWEWFDPHNGLPWKDAPLKCVFSVKMGTIARLKPEPGWQEMARNVKEAFGGDEEAGRRACDVLESFVSSLFPEGDLVDVMRKTDDWGEVSSVPAIEQGTL